MAACPATASVVATGSGPVRGTDGVVRVFKGIPFAAPPLGALRWTPPRVPRSWTAIRDATRFGADCMQAPWSVESGQKFSEDCLYLNVWTPARRATDRLPVMVFIYGGAFVGGSGALPLYDGTALARRGVLVVTFNYRLGIFGFLAHPELTAESPHRSSGNYGLLDQVAALRWVQDNIARFGGNPARVTVFGESAGATSVAMLLASPLAHGLFARAIAESPALGWRFSTSQQAEAKGAALGSLARLRQMPASALLSRNLAIAPSNPSMGPAPYPFPIVDGWVLPRQPNDAYAGGLPNPVPLIVGNNADEGSMFGNAWHLATPSAYQAKLDTVFGPRKAEAAGLYPAKTPAGISRAGADIVGDGIFYEGARMMARNLAASGQPSWRYLFTHRAGSRPPLHSDELRYVFGTLDSPGFTRQPPPGDDDRAVSQAMMAAWVRFAATGDPNGPGLARWPSAAGEHDPLLEFGDTPHPLSAYRSRQLDFIASFFTHP